MSEKQIFAGIVALIGIIILLGLRAIQKWDEHTNKIIEKGRKWVEEDKDDGEG